MNIEQQLVFAINHRRKITVESGGCNRMIESYLLFKCADNHLVLQVWQYVGESNTTPSPDWINIRLDSTD